ncbi:sialidase family protein [Nibrella saemangeumensis]|uniref:exo-alpha-sialidase n=1 Tax=Nibrella saemangeumensis TaxID=1084526 RepID=A0ABP8MMB1_9BACT
MNYYTFMFSSLLLALLLAGCQTNAQPVPARTPGAAPALEETAVFRNGEGGYNCYRIPAIVRAPDGALLAFAEGRRKDCDDFGDIDIVLRISRDGGKTWGDPILAVDYGANQAGNPAPVFDLTDPRYPNGRLFLVYNTGITSESNVRQGKAIREVWYKTSTDGGKSWSEAVDITTQVNRPNKPDANPAYTFTEDWRSYANTPGHALQLRRGRYAGRLFVAANHSAGPPQPQFRDYRAHGFYSDDHGKTWKLSPSVDYPGGNESTAAETSDGKVLMNIRNQSGDVKNRLQAVSPDAGVSWNAVQVMTALPDPVNQGSILTYQTADGRHVLLFSNAAHQTKRENLTVRISTDDGRNWSAGRTVYGGSAAYSDLVVQQDGQIGVLYERDDYTVITYAHFPFEWLIQ